MKNELRLREEKMIKRITYVILSVIALFLIICTTFYVLEKSETYSKEILGYVNENSGGYFFTNIEILQFLTTDDIIEYQSTVKTLMQNEEYKNVKHITILDTITNDEGSGTYEWLIICDNKKESMFANTFNIENATFAVTEYVQTEEMKDISDEQLQSIKEAALNSDNDYINGSINNLVGIEPVVNNVTSISGKLGENDYASFSEKLRVFLVETQNSRRTFTVIENSISDTTTNLGFVLKPDIILKNQNTIKVIYDKRLKTFDFEYTD